MFKNLSRFLERHPIEALINYDIKNESPWDEVIAEKAPIQKMQKYKDYNRNTDVSFDCDTCDFIDSIYQELWGWSYENRMSLTSELQNKFNNYWNRLGSDTMNSFSTIYRQALKINSDNKSLVKHNKHLQKFAILTHTIGNLTLVPFKIDSDNDKKSFNQYRGFRDNHTNKYFVYDFFDLSLKIIKENVDIQTFKEYIDTFYLHDFVNLDDNYSIKPLLKKHKALLVQNKISLDNPESFLPDNNDELNEYLMNVNKLIMQRSKRIVKVLNNKLENHDNKLTRHSKKKMKKASKKVLSFINKLKESSLEEISYFLNLLARIIGGGYALYLYVRFISLGGYGHSSPERPSSNLDTLFHSSYAIKIVFIIFVLSLFILCIAYSKRHKGMRRILMISSNVGTAFFLFLPIAIISFMRGLRNSEWFYHQYNLIANDFMSSIPNFRTWILIYLITFIIFSLLPFILILFDKISRNYLKHWFVSLLIIFLLIPLILGILASKGTVIFFSSVAAIIIAIGIYKGCFTCRKIYAYEKIESILLREENISIKVQNKHELENKDGTRSTGYSEQYIPGVRKHYKINYVCKHCGREKSKRKVVDLKSV